jgi:formylglycine-generating enzyme required for sulfatase activity
MNSTSIRHGLITLFCFLLSYSASETRPRAGIVVESAFEGAGNLTLSAAAPGLGHPSPLSDYSPTALPMVWIPPGTFVMGSRPGELDRQSHEGPPTQVTITHGFWLARHEVTQAEYQAVMHQNLSRFQLGGDYPVDSVTWYEAARYCARLTDQERASGRLPPGYAYRLPTEAEWEYAARAGTTSRFSHGDDPGYIELADYAWYGEQTRPLGQTAGLVRLAGKVQARTAQPVGRRRPNPWGLYDMYGNVEEWCYNGWRGSLPGVKVTDPQGPVLRQYRVLRGGSWQSKAKDCRSASRDFAWPDYRGKGTTGFRPALAPSPLETKE